MSYIIEYSKFEIKFSNFENAFQYENFDVKCCLAATYVFFHFLICATFFAFFTVLSDMFSIFYVARTIYKKHFYKYQLIRIFFFMQPYFI